MEIPKSAFTCSNLKIETPEQCVKIIRKINHSGVFIINFE